MPHLAKGSVKRIRNPNGWLAELQHACGDCLTQWQARFHDDPSFALALRSQFALNPGQELAEAALQHHLLAWFAEQAGIDDPPPNPKLLSPERIADLRLPDRLVHLLETAPLERLRPTLQEPAGQGPLLHYFQEWTSWACGPTRKRQQGVYYTPFPIVQYIVERSAALAPDWDQADTLLLDPSCGSGVFLRAAAAKWKQASLRGFELSPASASCCASLAHPRIGVQCLDSLQICDEELSSAAQVEPPARLMIVGNPPYSNFGRRRLSNWMTRLMADYKTGLAERKHNLHDDFIHFLRWSQHQVSSVGEGLVALVLNNSFLTGLTRRILRSSLLETFSRVEVLNLHGSVDKRETSQRDENVFGIRQGVAILILQKTRDQQPAMPARFRYASLRGQRVEKFRRLADHGQIAWQSWTPKAPEYCFVTPPHKPSAAEHAASTPASINNMATLADAAQYCSGVQTKWDRLFTDFCPQVLKARMERWLAGEDVAELGETPKWLVPRRASAQFRAECIHPYMMGPLDVRYLYYDPELIGRARYKLMRHMTEPHAKGLVFMRQSTNPGAYDHFLVVDCLVSDRVFYSAHGAPFLAPIMDDQALRLSDEWLDEHWPQQDRKTSDGQPKSFWSYYYGLFHSQVYRRTYDPQLRRSFPVLPPPPGYNLLSQVAKLGDQLMNAHLAGAQMHTAPKDSGAHAQPIAAKPSYDASRGEIVVHSSASIAAPEGALNWTIGGYSVIKRWLVQRRGRAYDDDCRAQLAQRIRCFRLSSQIGLEIDNIWGEYNS